MKIVLGFILIFLTHVHCFGQYSAEVGFQKLDSVLTAIKSFCPDYGSSKEIKKKMIRRDKKIIMFLNHFYRDDFTLEQIKEETVAKFRSMWYESNKKEIGNVTHYEQQLRSDGNLKVFVHIATFNDEIVFRQIHIETSTQLDCKKPYEPYVSWYDIPYLQHYCLPLLRFPITLFETFPAIIADTTTAKYLDKVDVHYKPLLFGDSARYFNQLTWNSITSYTLGLKESPLKFYVALSNTELLEKLLYSPNHIIAIYAYEALKNRIDNLSDETKIQMNLVLNSPVKIHWWSGDVGHYGKTYKELITPMAKQASN